MWKDWFVNHCWNVFSIDKWKKRSQTFAVLLGLALVLSILSLLFCSWLHSQMHSSTQSPVVLVPREKVLLIDGQQYIPIRMLV